MALKPDLEGIGSYKCSSTITFMFAVENYSYYKCSLLICTINLFKYDKNNGFLYHIYFDHLGVYFNFMVKLFHINRLGVDFPPTLKHATDFTLLLLSCMFLQNAQGNSDVTHTYNWKPWKRWCTYNIWDLQDQQRLTASYWTELKYITANGISIDKVWMYIFGAPW